MIGLGSLEEKDIEEIDIVFEVYFQCLTTWILDIYIYIYNFPCQIRLTSSSHDCSLNAYLLSDSTLVPRILSWTEIS